MTQDKPTEFDLAGAEEFNDDHKSQLRNAYRKLQAKGLSWGAKARSLCLFDLMLISLMASHRSYPELSSQSSKKSGYYRMRETVKVLQAETRLLENQSESYRVLSENRQGRCTPEQKNETLVHVMTTLMRIGLLSVDSVTQLNAFTDSRTFDLMLMLELTLDRAYLEKNWRVSRDR